MSQHGRFEQDYLRMKSTDRQTESLWTIRGTAHYFFGTGQNDTAFRASSFH